MQTRENEVVASVHQILDQVRRVIVGKDEALLWVLAALLAKGHILLEDVPGVGKTTMALSFARALDLEYGRIQFTPDVLPSDVTGYSVPDGTGNMVYRPGGILCNLFLADELNRATSRTQSALLEAMEEGQVTVDGVSHPLPRPFAVIATQNPTGAAGTQLLPDSQIDRFALRIRLGYPAPRDEAAMIKTRQGVNPLETVRSVLTRQKFLTLQETVEATFLSDSVIDYIVALCDATRKQEFFARGASPRGTLSVAAMSKSIAQLRGRDFVVPGDVKEVFIPTLAHRMILTGRAETQGKTAEQVLKSILDATPAPPPPPYAEGRVHHRPVGGRTVVSDLRAVAGLDISAGPSDPAPAFSGAEHESHPGFSAGAYRPGAGSCGGKNGADADGLLRQSHAAFQGENPAAEPAHR